jgi:hypothetical protein
VDAELGLQYRYGAPAIDGSKGERHDEFAADAKGSSGGSADMTNHHKSCSGDVAKEDTASHKRSL